MELEKKITVIHFVYTLYGGVANVAANLMNYQYSKGYNPILAYYEYDEAIDSQLNFSCKKIHVKMKGVPGESMLIGLHIGKIYNEYIKNHPEELVIVHAHNVQTLGTFGNWKKIPLICTLHGFNCVTENVFRKKISDILYRRTISKLIRYDKKITAVSKAIVDAKELIGINKKNEISIIHNFADVCFEKRIKHDLFTIGFVGDLSYAKGWDTIWKAYTMLPKFYRERISFCSAGKEADFSYEWIKNKINSTTVGNNIYYEGYVKNAKIDFIPKLDILIITSRNEGLGLVQIEAMGYGIPVLGRNTGGICEVLNDGYNGFVINDEKDLCDKIIMLYENKKGYSYLSKNALITYQEKFTSKIIMEKYSQIYSEMINKNI